MWSHVIAGPITLPTPTVYLTGDSYAVYRLHIGESAYADRLPLTSANYYYADSPNRDSGIGDPPPTVGGPFTASGGRIWLPGALFDDGAIHSRRMNGAKWESATETILPGWTATVPLESTFNNWAGGTSYADRDGGGLNAVSVINYSGGGTRNRIIYGWDGVTDASSTFSEGGTYADFLRAAGSLGSDRTASATLTPFNYPSVTNYPYWAGQPLLIFKQAGSWYCVGRGFFNYEGVSGGTFQRIAYALWRASGDPRVSGSWDTMQTQWSGYDLNALGVVGGTGSDYGDSSRAGNPAHQLLRVGGDIYIATSMNRLSTGASTLADPTCVRRMDSAGALHDEFDLPTTISYSGTHAHFGALGTYQGGLYAVTVEGWTGTGYISTDPMTLRLWQRVGAGSWSEVSHWTRTQAEFGSPLVASLLDVTSAAYGAELVVALDSPKAWSGKTTYGLMCWAPGRTPEWREDTQWLDVSQLSGTQFGGALPRLFNG